MRTLCTTFALALVAGCGNSTSTTTNDLSTTATGDLTMTETGDLTMVTTGDQAMSSTDGGMVTLTLEDYLSWCSVSVNSGSSSTTGTQTLQFPKGTTVNLSGDKASSVFVWGYWVGTTGDTGASHDTSMMTTVKMDSDKTVQACCPFASAPNTPCPPPT